MACIFIIEDNESIREALASYLRLQDHDVREFDKIQGVLATLAKNQADLLVLDVMLSDGNGFELAKKIRQQNQVPILFLTARTSEMDRITGFEVGADDYVVKPFSPKEVVLRIEAILKRSKQPVTEKNPLKIRQFLLTNGDTLVLDSLKHLMQINNQDIHLTASEWKILEYLIENESRLISREQILTNCLDYIDEGYGRAIDTHIKNIRIKLGNSQWIETVRGYGYKFNGKKNV